MGEPLAEDAVLAVETNLRRGRPLGDERWTARTAQQLGLGFTLRARGRPAKVIQHCADPAFDC